MTNRSRAGASSAGASADDNDGDLMLPEQSPRAWANGILLKRVTGGYTWSISVGAGGSDPDSLTKAVEAILDVDSKLQDRYGPCPPGR
jgi:hypothetical protein